MTSCITFQRWITCLPRWILRTRTKLAWVLSSSFAIQCRSDETSSALLPLPLFSLECFRSSGPGLSRRKFLSVCKARLLNVWVLVLDFLYLGRWPTVGELRRCPNSNQLAVFERLRTLLSACGEAQDEFSLCPGRSSPELAAALYQLESFSRNCADLGSGYMDKAFVPFEKDPNLLKSEDFPELLPYRSLDADRLRLIGEGKWHMETFLDGPLWLPFQEPAFLLHGFPVSEACVPNFKTESPAECMKLAKVWDARGLLFLCPEPLVPGHFSKVFNAFKDREKDRQIGDRRLPNMAEYHIDGPSKTLPQGQQLTLLRIPRFTHMLRGSMTGRRDFYHQACVSKERARTNMLPFAFPLLDFQGTRAFDSFVDSWTLPTSSAREHVGDFLGSESKKPGSKKRAPLPEKVYPCFASLFQGDHLGVEFALRSHSLLLENHGLLAPSTRVLGGHAVPIGCQWDALVIDDYFALGAERLSTPIEQSFAMKALAQARKVYAREGLIGSSEKDICAASSLKAAGAEIRSGEANVRRGVVPIGAPFAKRIALSTLSLRAASLPGVTSDLLARLVGNWVSVFQYRKCLSSVIDTLFKFSSDCMQFDVPKVFSFSRQLAQELTLAAVMAPLIFSNVAVDYLGEVFATDASNAKGAVVSAQISGEVQESLWQSVDKKGSYTHLDNSFHAILRHVGECDEDLDVPGPRALSEPIAKQPLMYFDFVEICGGAGKVTAALADLGRSVAPVLDLTHSRHYDLTSDRLTEWIIYMLEENRFRSFLIAPPCTSFSPAAHPAVRSYREPLGFDRLNPKVLLGNRLAFRALLLLRVGRRCFRPCGAEQSRLSKMCWLALWKSLLELGFEEAVIASCVFGSIHKKEFRLLCYLLDTDFLDRRCPGGHTHVRVEGAYTKPSAVYVDGLAHHIALAFHDSLASLDAKDRLSPDVHGLESAFSNDVMISSEWTVVRDWFWKKPSHINVLELASAVSCLGTVAKKHSSVRFACFLDSAVCRGALAKGRSASHALQPGLKRACAWCLCFDLYPVWPFTPTRLNVADDPTRGSEPRSPVSLSLVHAIGIKPLQAVASGLRRFAANWVRLAFLILSSHAIGVTGLPFSDEPACERGPLALLRRSVWDLPLSVWICFVAFCQWIFVFSSLAVLLGFGLVLGFCFIHVLCPASVECIIINPQKWSPRSRPFGRSVRIAMVVWLICSSASAVPLGPCTEAERQRFQRRDGTQLFAMRAIKQQTRDRRKVYLTWFREWLWEERQISFRSLIDKKPPDPERLAELLVDYGKALYRAGKAYGIYAETINSVAVERPLIRRSLTTAWDLAFAWLQDEPHSHHPAMPLTVMAAMVVVALYWGWPYEAAVILMSWTGVMRIGEVLSAKRKDVVLPGDAAPGTSFLLIVIQQPKTRGRAAKHQAARIDQEDVIRFLSAMYQDFPSKAALWPFSAATLRKRFVQLLSALELPTSKWGGGRPFDLGSMRPGGATWMLFQTENPEYVRRRGRWLSARVMEVYLQEVLVSTYVERLKPRTRELIELCSGEFAVILERSISFLKTGIPPKAWYSLLKGAADIPFLNVEKVGQSGGFSVPFSANETAVA